MGLFFRLTYRWYIPHISFGSNTGGLGLGVRGIRASLENSFESDIFITGFFGNAILAASLAYMGDRLGVPIYLAAVVVFGTRLFQNFAVIRRHLFNIRRESTK